MSASYIQRYYQKLRTWNTAVSLEHLWSISINFPQSLYSAEGYISRYEGDPSSLENNPLSIIDSNSKGDEGCFYARSVTLPTESGLVEMGTTNGYLNPLISKGRAAPGEMRISFLETHVSIESIFRAWIKLVGMYGLVYRGDMNLHGSITVALLSQANGGPEMITRRKIEFEGLVPVSCSGSTYTQNTLGGSVSVDVSFKFERYKIIQT
jgi:hypothetical protein